MWEILDNVIEPYGEQGKLHRWYVLHSNCGSMKDPMIVIGINPSGGTVQSNIKGEPDKFSPTAMRLHRIAENAGKHSIILLNISPVVDKTVPGLLTRIDEIKKARKANLDHISSILGRYNVPEDVPVLLCFGNAYSKVIKEETMRSCLSEILEHIPSKNLKCLGLTRKGNPKHPLFAGTSELIDYPSE